MTMIAMPPVTEAESAEGKAHAEGQHYFARLTDGTMLCACGSHIDRFRRPIAREVLKRA